MESWRGTTRKKEREKREPDLASTVELKRKLDRGHFPKEKLLPGAAYQHRRILYVRGYDNRHSFSEGRQTSLNVGL